MNAFISYSLNNKEQYLTSLLAGELKSKGFIVYHSGNFAASSSVARFIQKSDLFIGIITVNGHNNSIVIKEWKYANKAKVPTILLVEKGYPLSSDVKAIRFDRKNPKTAVDKLMNLPKKYQASPTRIQSNHDAKAALTFGLVTLGIVGLMSLLSDKK